MSDDTELLLKENRGKYRLVAWTCPEQGWVVDGKHQPPEKAVFQMTDENGQCIDINLNLEQLLKSDLPFVPEDKDCAINVLKNKRVIF